MAQSALIAADGKLGVGLGHISRCRALQAELESLGFEAKLVDTQELEENLNQTLWDLIAIDSYVLPLEAYEKVVRCAKTCLFFDDTLRLDYPKAILLNNASGVNVAQYREKYPHHLLFLGSDYRLLQPPFVQVLKNPPIPLKQEVKNVFITLGGSDILGLNSPLIVAFKRAYPDLNLHCIARDSTILGAKLYRDLCVQEMVDLIRRMDLCICACGQSLGEILACGIPAIALEVAANQNANLVSFKNCILSIPKAYALSCDSICYQVLEHFKSYSSLHLRTTHQARALEILKRSTKWKEFGKFLK
ncbi:MULTISPECIES: hypothetical protein [Helicobacter]|uniref:hypothetical protein n=1 Tax=Helicobacter TaxID=209 RepID=UPI002609DF3F|nr:hypothetical protein [Helicobacter sp. UBA3407]